MLLVANVANIYTKVRKGEEEEEEEEEKQQHDLMLLFRLWR